MNSRIYAADLYTAIIRLEVYMDTQLRFLFTSSLLILSVLLLRALFRNKISMRMQYALWLPVAFQLLLFPLIPQLESPLSIQMLSRNHTGNISAPDDPVQKQPEIHTAGKLPDTPAVFGKSVSRQRDSASETAADAASRISFPFPLPLPEPLCLMIARTGSLLLLFYFTTINFLFFRYLRQNRIPFAAPSAPLPVWLVSGLPSPCLAGCSIYLTPEIAADPRRLSHVLAHESCHYRHADQLWAIVRCLCIACCWWNPLVWLAANLSHQDCELACDEAALRLLGDTERLSYGRTVISLIPVKPSPKNFFSITTTMTGGNRKMKQRIKKIASYKKTSLSACILAVFLSVLCLISISTIKPEASQPDKTADPQTAKSDARNRSSSIQDTDAQNQDSDAWNRKQNRNSFSEEAVFDLDQAIGLAVLSSNADSYLPGECRAEGHMELGRRQHSDGSITIYALTTYGEYAFYNHTFVKHAGTGTIPVVLDFSYDDSSGYVLKNYQQPLDGSYYLSSIHEMFPEHLWNQCLTYDAKVYEQLFAQEKDYARQYLIQIGRPAYAISGQEPDSLSLTQAGVSIRVSNSLLEPGKEKLASYPMQIGNLEQLEHGVRYLYELDLDKEKGEIIYRKSEYDTGKIVELFRFDSETGEEITGSR